jgi:hypothetical protein
MRRKLPYIVFEDFAIRRALKYARKEDSVLRICGQKLVSLMVVKLGDLDWCYTMRGPARSPEADALVTAGLVDKY